MIGCDGNIGYIYVPYSQIQVTPNTSTANLNGSYYKLDTSRKLFKEVGLPSVGSMVTLNIDARLLSYDQILKNPGIAKKIDNYMYVYNKQAGTARLREYRFNVGRVFFTLCTCNGRARWVICANKRIVSFAIAHSDSHRYAAPAVHEKMLSVCYWESK